jgi:predicted DNA binding CopG/RHH family protein
MPSPPKTQPRPVGRPKLHDRAKSSIVPVRFSAEDRKRVENAATAKGMTVSDWIRNILNAALEE